MSSVSTAFKVHYNQKLGTHSAILGGTHHGLWGIDAPDDNRGMPYQLYCNAYRGLSYKSA